MTIDELDILAFGAHADDVEIGMGGTIAKYSEKGYKIGICDLTEAELSSNGNVTIRKQEAKNAADILGVSVRENLAFPDRGLAFSEEKIRKIVQVIRRLKPAIIFSPYHLDRHPDHGQCTALIKEALFSAAIIKYNIDGKYPPYRVKRHYYYMINGFHSSDFVVDISAHMNVKIESLDAYESQFVKGDKSVETPLTNGYVESIKARELLFGKEVGVMYAEGFKSDIPVLLNEDFIPKR